MNRNKIKMPWREYVGAIRPALTGCLVMSIAVELLKHSLTSSFPPSARLGREVLAEGAAYVLTLTMLHHSVQSNDRS